MVPEVERLTQSRCRGQGRAYFGSFRLGAALAIRDAIKAERDKLREELRGKVSETALTIVDTRKREADDWMNSRHRLGRASSSARIGSSEGFAAGRAAGASVYGSASRGQVTGGQRRLNG